MSVAAPRPAEAPPQDLPCFLLALWRVRAGLRAEGWLATELCRLVSERRERSAEDGGR